MKKKIIEILKERGVLNITDLLNLMPEIKGEYSLYMPVKEGGNRNILWIGNVNLKFKKAFDELLMRDKIIAWYPADVWEFLWMGSPCYKLPLVTPRRAKCGKKECWMPITIRMAKP